MHSHINNTPARNSTFLFTEPESFFVAEREGPLEEGELERAARWAEEVFKQFETSRSVQQDKTEVH